MYDSGLPVMTNNFKTPVLFLIFNRPDTTQLVFNEIKKIKPSILFIAADGPRNSLEIEKVKNTRRVIEQIDWQCDVKTLFHDENLGCRLAVSSAIDWFFNNNEMGIILEDDCLPNQSFFYFCSELLEKYLENEKVMQISGFNALFEVKIDESYFFGKFGPIWGWASWRRAWQHYDLNISEWNSMKLNGSYKKYCDSFLEAKWRTSTYDKIVQGTIDTWDYQWSFTKFYKNGLSIIPSKNLIINIGFGDNATHTKGKKSSLTFRELSDIKFPLKHPKLITRNRQLDIKFFNNFVLKNKIKDTLKKIFGR